MPQSPTRIKAAGTRQEKETRRATAFLADGGILQTVGLPAPPIFNGSAMAGGRLYVTLTGGSVPCLGP